jgi:catechol 2,3-dioxygenase-like lactoylglutathione lyase family enzyme
VARGHRQPVGLTMTTVMFGNHSAVVLPRSERDRVRRFYRDVLGCVITRQTDDKDDIRIGQDFYLGVLYELDGIALDEVSFSKSTFLELKVDDVEAMRQRIVDFGVNVVDMPDPHLYFQAPGGQPFRLVGIDEDLSNYEGTTSHRVLPQHFR